MLQQDLLLEGNFEPSATAGTFPIAGMVNSPEKQDLTLATANQELIEAFHRLELFRFANFSSNFSEIEHLANLSDRLDISVVDKFQKNIRISYTSLTSLLLTYAVFMLLGGVGNGLVIAAVIRNSTLRTARNMFLLNLALSDLLLCVLTMPLTILEIVTQHWPLSEVACKAAGTLQGSTVFASTLSIVAIALDRHMVSR